MESTAITPVTADPIRAAATALIARQPLDRERIVGAQNLPGRVTRRKGAKSA